jgi:hypothetical protein
MFQAVEKPAETSLQATAVFSARRFFLSTPDRGSSPPRSALRQGATGARFKEASGGVRW